MLRRSLILFAALAAVLGLVAASPGATSPPQFPVTIKAANGDVVIKKRPTRVVSLSPSATEDLFAVGADQPRILRERLGHALPHLGENFVVLYGDSYLDCDYRGRDYHRH